MPTRMACSRNPTGSDPAASARASAGEHVVGRVELAIRPSNACPEAARPRASATWDPAVSIRCPEDVDQLLCAETVAGQADEVSFFSFGGPQIPEPEEEREPYRRQPPLLGPSPDEVGRPMPASFVLARSEAAAVAVQAIRAYSTGCVFEIAWAIRRTDETAAQWRDLHDIAFRHVPVDRDDGGSLLIGVALGDGTTARTNDRFDWREPGPGPRFLSFGGSGGGGGTERIHGKAEYWLYPLPPAPTMELICAWPRFEIEESRRVVDTTSLLDAASSAHWIWPEDADLPDADDH